MEISADQNTIKIDGLTVKFYPTKRELKKLHCLKCFLLNHPGVDCLNIPCREWDRSDRKNGVFSIREIPIN
jgi:hypothetical protein